MRTHTCTQGPLCQTSDRYLNHERPQVIFLNPITVEYDARGLVSDVICDVICDVCDDRMHCGQQSCLDIMYSPGQCAACFMESLDGSPVRPGAGSDPEPIGPHSADR